jgi:hypothetical protein
MRSSTELYVWQRTPIGRQGYLRDLKSVSYKILGVVPTVGQYQPLVVYLLAMNIHLPMRRLVYAT